jgi:hypothetical protein
MDDNSNTSQNVYLVYDDECPVCRNYTKYVRVREAFNLHLVDARQPSEMMDDITARGLDIDEGMVLIIGDALYYSSDAMHMLALLGSTHNGFNKLNYYIFRNKTASHILYPICKEFRNLVLWLCRIKRIRNLENTNRGSR